MNAFLFLFLFLIGLALVIGAFVLGAHIVMWNVNDIRENGANAWNSFWLLLVLVAFAGGASKVGS